MSLRDDVLDDVDRAVDGAPDAAGQADHIALAVADGRDAMQRALDAGAVVLAEIAHVLDHHLQVGQRDLVLAQHHLAVAKARLRQAAQVHHDFEQVALALGFFQRLCNPLG